MVVYRCCEVTGDEDDSCAPATMTRPGCRVVVYDGSGRVVGDHAITEFSTGLTSTETATVWTVRGSE